MYSRQNREGGSPRISLPQNYGGSFLRDPNIFRTPSREEAVPTREKLRSTEEQESTVDAPREEKIREDSYADRALSHPQEENALSGALASISKLFNISPAQNFPFGHGLGFEELFILGMILAISGEGGADGNIIMFLVILLFCG